MKGYFIDSDSMNELWARLTEIDLENVNAVRDALGFAKGILYPIKLEDYAVIINQNESEHKRTLDADELLKRIEEKCKTPSLSEDTVNGLCGATAIIYDMLIESGQEE